MGGIVDLSLEENMTDATANVSSSRPPCNTGKLVGPKAPLAPKDI
jgi:hypothetical protein